jgi:hypothetical protein
MLHPASLLTGLGPDLADRLPEAKRAIGDGDLGRHRQTPALEIEQQGAPVVSALSRAVDKAEQLLLALRRGADDDQDALRLVLQTRLKVDAVGPDIDVALADRSRSLHCLCSSIQTSFSRAMVAADKPGASLPSKAASAGAKSPLDTPFR